MSRPPQRFVIRRISIGAKTNLPWTLTDTHRPSYIGRYPTQTAALAEVDRIAPPLRFFYAVDAAGLSLGVDAAARVLAAGPLLPRIEPPRRHHA